MKKSFSKIAIISTLLFSLGINHSDAATFNDIPEHWCSSNIEKAVELNIANGYTDGGFRPDAPVTRAEFIALTNKTFGYTEDILNEETVIAKASLEEVKEGDESSPIDLEKTEDEKTEDLIRDEDSYNELFESSPSEEKPEKEELKEYNDVSKDSWYYNQIKIAQKKGYISGYPGDLMKPDDPISREQAATIVARILGLSDDYAIAEFDDAAYISEYAYYSVGALSSRGIIAGYNDGRFDPQGQIKRAESVILLLKSIGQDVKFADPENSILVIIDGKYYYQDETNGAIVLRGQTNGGVVDIKGTRQFLDLDNTVKEGWHDINGKKYYSKLGIGFVKGWEWIGDSWFYFDPANHFMYSGGIKCTGLGVYWFGNDGRVKVGYRGGYRGFNWAGPTEQELSNAWLYTEDAPRIIKGQSVINYAIQHEGRRFRYWGCDLNDYSGVYCCGAVYSAYKEVGLRVPGPADCNMYADDGFKMVEAQYVMAPEFGGQQIPLNYDTMWPADIMFAHHGYSRYRYNHAVMYMGKNGNTPMIIHACNLGFVMEPASVIPYGWGSTYVGVARYN